MINKGIKGLIYNLWSYKPIMTIHAWLAVTIYENLMSEILYSNMLTKHQEVCQQEAGEETVF